MNIQSVQLGEDGTMQVTLIDGTAVSVPDDMSNRHRRKLQVWLDAGNTPDPYVPPVPTYTELRQRAYPPIGDQLDALWKGGQAQAGMKIIIDGVKATYPKV